MADVRTPISSNHIVAFFHDRSDALDAIADLRDAGFTSDQIGLAVSDQDVQTSERDRDRGLGGGAIAEGTGRTASHKSMWDKIKGAFSGEPETYVGDQDYYQTTFAHLNVSGDRARYYGLGIASGGAVVTVTAQPNRLEEARQILENNDGDLRISGFEASEFAGLGGTGTGAERRLQLRGELLRAVKERINKGEIRLRKEVVTEHQTINVPVTREEVIVEQVPPSSHTPASGAIGKEGEVRIPVSEERVRVTKEPVVTGEVRVQKRAVQDTEQVSDEVRHEEVKVENEGDVKVTDKTKKKKPAA